MNDRCLVDTNVLVYAAQTSHEKSARANGVILTLADSARAWTTSQVVGEFYSSVTRPRPTGSILSHPDAVVWIDAWLTSAHFLDLTEAVSREALRAAFAFQMNIYDAQMWAVARTYQIPFLVTEDMQSQPEIEGVRYVNPFSDSFELADIGR